jgi:hypothetical protein
MIDLSHAVWRKASRSNGANASCVELASLAGAVAVRDSKRPDAGAHVLSPATFSAFLADVKAGRYDL